MKKKSNILSRKHPLGFTILQEKTQPFESDQHIFFHSQQILSCSVIEQNENKLKSKKLRGLRKNEEKGRTVLKNLGLTSETLLVNPRYEECYFKLDNGYFCVTDTGPKTPKINHFDFFITNGCLFGTNIQGIQADGKLIPLIDHQLKVSSPIQDIIVENKFHPYEDNNFNTLAKQVSLMKKIGADGFSIIYHLPIIDYMLSAILKFVRGEINFAALDKFIFQVKIRGNSHKKKLQEIARNHQVNISIVSPFDNLWDAKQEIEIHPLLSILEIKNDQRNGQLANTDEVAEKQFVKRLLFLLQTNEYTTEFKKIWLKLLSKDSHSETINSLKDLLSTGNASVIAYATTFRHSSNQNKTCAWLSADEYPVFAHYKRTMSKAFGEVICFSFLPSILNYVGMKSNGSGQQTLFRYLPDYPIPVAHNATIELPRKLLRLSPDSFYISTLNYKFCFFLYFLSRNHLFFLRNFPLQQLHIFYQLNKNWFDSSPGFNKKNFLTQAKDDKANKSINYYVFFGKNKIKIKFKNYQENLKNSCCPIL